MACAALRADGGGPQNPHPFLAHGSAKTCQAKDQGGERALSGVAGAQLPVLVAAPARSATESQQCAGVVGPGRDVGGGDAYEEEWEDEGG